MTGYTPDGDGWRAIAAGLMLRSGERCEVQSPVCVAPSLAGIPRDRWSIHHRLPRGAGGTTDPDGWPRLLAVCGHGTKACHWYVETNRTLAYHRGWLVRRGDDPAAVPLVLPSGRRVLLDTAAPFYLPAPAPAYDTTTPP